MTPAKKPKNDKKKGKKKGKTRPNNLDTKRGRYLEAVAKRVAADKATFLRSLKSKLGVVSAASLECNISRTTFYDWLHNDPAFKRKVDQINEHAIDFVESKMFEGINNGDRQLIQFFLSTRGKKRGYTTRLEVQQDKRGIIQLNVTQFENDY